MGGISSPLEIFLDYLRECVQVYHIAEDGLAEADALTQDILHSLELEKHDEAEYLALARELVEARRKRRVAKNRLMTTAPVLGWLEGNQSVVKGMERLLGEIRKAERSMENRIYIPKVRK